ncbi:MAG: hypothetical protein NW224_10080 [Leptolyngbyaceae cyanobacterium bins.302]|nr:hypothetical protein [Leptolyngbyaceae cyanobacterium bins.302]
MTKVSAPTTKDVFRWQYLARVLQDLPLDEMAWQINRGITRQWRSGSGLWFMVGAGALALLYWNGRLFVATGAGIGVMVLVYLMHDWKPSLNLLALRKFLDGWNQPFLVAVGAGAIATLTTYLAASVWVDAESHWIASGAILQSMGTLTVLLLLITQMLNRQERRDRIPYNKLVSDLVQDDPLKRLIAVRQLTDAISVLEDDHRDRRSGLAKKPTRHEIADYFRLMLNREEDPIVRDAIYDGLQTLDIVYQLKQANAPLLQLTPRYPVTTKSKRLTPTPTFHEL